MSIVTGKVCELIVTAKGCESIVKGKDCDAKGVYVLIVTERGVSRL